MDLKSGEGSRHRRKTRSDEEDKWECSVCTYINPSESYKCEICFMRKGTSTRKPRVNPQVLEQQQLIAQAILKEKDEEHRKRKSERATEKPAPRESNVKLKNFDRSSPLLFEIFANGYSVVITEFPPKSKGKTTHFPDSPAASNCSSLLGFSGTTSAVPDQLSPTDSNSNSDAISRAFPFADLAEYGDGVETKAKLGSNLPGRHPPHSTRSTATCNGRSTPLGHTGSSVSSGIVVDATRSGSPIPSSSSAASCPPGPTQKHEFTPESQSVARTNSDTKVEHSLLFSASVGSRKSTRSEYTRYVPSRLAKSNSRSNISSAKRPSLDEGRSRRKRLPVDDIRLRSTPVSRRKRRKLVLPRARLVRPKSKRRRTRLSKPRRSSASTGRCVTDQTESVLPDSMAHREHVTENATPLDAKKFQSGKRFSSTPLGLKCKIRVIPSTDSSSKSSYRTVENQQKTVELPNPGLDIEMTRNEGDDDSVGRSTSESGEALSSNKPTRLSAESKNTSAMTDSGGATALEMSG